MCHGGAEIVSAATNLILHIPNPIAPDSYGVGAEDRYAVSFIQPSVTLVSYLG